VNSRRIIRGIFFSMESAKERLIENAILEIEYSLSLVWLGMGVNINILKVDTSAGD